MGDENQVEGQGQVEGESGDQGGGQVRVEGEQIEGRAASDKGEQMIPKSRFDEINNALRQFKALGLDVAGIQKMQQRVKFMEENPGKRYTDKEIHDIESELSQVPGIAAAIQSAQRYNAFMERQNRNYTSEGTRQTEGFLKEMGREVNDKTRAALTNAICGIIQSDPDLMDRFLGHDSSVFKEAFKSFKEGVIGGGERRVPGLGDQLKKSAPKPGSLPSKGKPAERVAKEPQSERDMLDEAGEAAFDTLLAHEGN